ncbi:hypothetical protein DS259_21755 [Salmonella enterica subsp. indica]|nr:hypothetical protein [Salmonella enterica subsp. indica]
MVKSLSVMGITDSDFPMSSITGRANFLLTTSTGGGIQMGVRKCLVYTRHFSRRELWRKKQITL